MGFFCLLVANSVLDDLCSQCSSTCSASSWTSVKTLCIIYICTFSSVKLAWTEIIPKLGKFLIRRTLLISDYNPFLLKGKLNSFREWRCSRFAPCGTIPLSIYFMCELSAKLRVDYLWFLRAGVTHYISVGNLRSEGFQALEGRGGPVEVMLVFWHN